MRSAGWKAKWFKPKQAVQERAAQMAQEAEAQQTVQDLSTAGQIAEQAGRGIGALAQGANAAMQPPEAMPAPAPRRRPAGLEPVR
jgi:hypothetical protein